MLAALFDRIVTLADDRRDFKTLNLPGGREILVRRPDVQVETFGVPPGNRQFVAGDLDSFIELLTEDDTSPVAVFVPHDFDCENPQSIEVVGFFDRNDRREKVTLQVALSTPLVAVHALNAASPQKRVVELLRDCLIDCCDPALLAMMRALDFTRRNDGSSTIDHGRESLGASIEASVRSKRGELPETIELDLPMFADPPFSEFRRKIQVSIEIDATNQRIRFAPRADQLHVAYRSGISTIASLIESKFSNDGAMVVIGRP